MPVQVIPTQYSITIYKVANLTKTQLNQLDVKNNSWLEDVPEDAIPIGRIDQSALYFGQNDMVLYDCESGAFIGVKYNDVAAKQKGWRRMDELPKLIF